MILPGFIAEASIGTANHYAHISGASSNVELVIPQFSMRAFVCGAVVAAVLAGQEELIPVMVRVCSDAA